MSLISAFNLGKEYGPDEIFSGVSVEVPQKARIALVGANGAGKTTLLNLLIGLDQPTTGTVSRAKGLRIGFLSQRPELRGDHTLWDEMIGAFDDLRTMEQELNALATRLDEPEVMARYGELQERFELRGGYTYEGRVRQILQGLSFAESDYTRPLTQLSGGQKTRAVLGRLLLEQPDLLALDEPTNHLDITAVEWLEGFLKEFPGAVVVVSHDRYFMDSVASIIWEMDFGALELYRGNYTHYVQQREERHERLFKEFESQQSFIAKEEDYIRRNIAGQNTRQAQGRRTRLERLRREGLVRRPRARRAFHLALGATARSGDNVVIAKRVRVGYDADHPLFDAADLSLRRGDVAALIGPNGAGKSTFVKTIIGQLPPLMGEVKLGAAVSVGYFAQAHETLNERLSILDAILEAKPMPISEARGYLGKYLFEGDDVFRPIHTLSGGERGRVALARLALSSANLLILDEPTNHLDIATQEILQNVIADFAGTVLIVSHDRYLIDALATQIWAIESGGLSVFSGTYREYLAERERRRQAATEAAAQELAVANGATSAGSGTAAAVASTRKNGLTPYQRRKRIDDLEQQIADLEGQIAAISADLERASASADAGRAASLGVAYTTTDAELHRALSEWEALIDD